MNALQHDLAHAMTDARLAAARERQLAAAARRARPPRRRFAGASLRRTTGRRSTRLVSIGTGGSPAPAAELERLLAGVAERVAEHGTRTEAPVLEAMSAAVDAVSPGAAAALVDWDGSEVARLRAFGLVHGLVLDSLAPSAQSALLDRVLGRDRFVLAG
jgi:hypothetical protein